MALLEALNAELIAEIADGEALAVAGGPWLDGVLSTVFPDLAEGLRTRPVARDKPRPRSDIDSPWGQPGHVLGVLRTFQSAPVKLGRDVMFSKTSWPRFLGRLRNYPFGATVEINELDERGFPVHRGRAYIGLRRDFRSPGWCHFNYSALAIDTGWPDSPEIQDGWAEFVKEQAARIGACAGSMTDDYSSLGETALQRAIGGLTAGVDQSRALLRGYSWVTIVAAEQAAQLGGAKALAASGAFCDVTMLPNGAVWLRATPTINEFTGDKIRAVFETLAPVLPIGRAELRGHFMRADDFRILDDVDAADYR
jgi:hypothetical protein